MYSAELDQADLSGLRPSAGPALKKPLDRLQRVWRSLQKDAQLLPGPQQAYQVLGSPPDKLLQALQQTAAALGDEMQSHPAGVDAALQRFYFDVLHFLRLAESFGTHSLFDLTQSGALGNRQTARSSRLCLRNIVPAPFLAPRFAAARSVALFSATLGPQHYHADLLGLPDDRVWVDVPSPFRAEQLAVRLVTDLSTRYQHRESSLAPIARLMAQQYHRQPGNYLVFLSSYDYLEQLAQCFARRHPEVPMWQQTRRMDEPARDAFLARFTSDGRGIGFAVLGGAFAEGIDLPGQRLIGAFIATLGLPQVNPVNEQIRRRMGENFGVRQAHDYTYLYPGLQKVVQAAGRVIRTTCDQGVIFLMDDRFARPEVRRMLPAWWQPEDMLSRPAAGNDSCAVCPSHETQP
jgi:DNA excision repair protein ERCC-2